MLDGERRQRRVRHQRTRDLTLLQQAAKDLPVALTGLENTHVGPREPGGDGRAGLGRRQGLLEDPRVRRDPEERPERQPRKPDQLRAGERAFEPGSARFVLLGPGDRRGAAGWRRAGSPVERTLDALEELGDVVQAEARSQVAQVAGRHPERLGRRGISPAGETTADRVVDHVAKRPPGPAGLRAQLGHHVVIQGQRRAHHALMLRSRHQDVECRGAHGPSKRSRDGARE